MITLWNVTHGNFMDYIDNCQYLKPLHMGVSLSVIKPRVMVVDDQPPNVEALRFVMGDMFADLAYVQTQDEFAPQYESVKPDVVIMDLMLDPYMESNGNGATGRICLDGLKLMETAKDENSTAKFLVLTQFAYAQTAISCYKAGAKGFLPKVHASSEQVMEAVMVVLSGSVYIPTGYETLESNRMRAYTSEQLRGLTQEEIDLISLTISDYSYEEIADHLEFKTAQSLRNKISRMLKKTPYTSMSRVATYCATLGMKPIS